MRNHDEAEHGQDRPGDPGVPDRSRGGDRGELSAGERARLERHLESCPTCPPLYASLVGVREKLGGLRDPDTVVPPTLAEQIRTAVLRRC